MHDQKSRTANDIGVLPGLGGLLQHPLTRRRLLRSAAGLGASTLALGVAGPGLVSAGQWRAPITAGQYSSDVAIAWLRLAFQIMPSTPGVSTLPGLRVFGYLGVTLYESVIGGMPGRQSLAGQLNDLTPVPGQANRAYHWPSVANSALATSMRELFRMTSEENLAAIDDMETALAAAIGAHLPFGIAKRSASRGRQVADHIMEWAASDGGHDGHLTNFPPDFVPPVGEGLWVPTPPAFQSSYQPYWGNNRPLALSSAQDYSTEPPPEFSTESNSDFYEAEMEVYDTVNNLTDEQRAIAAHWTNSLGHHMSIVTQAVERQHADLATAAVAFARAGITVSDAITACFYSKYQYNMIRPVSYIRLYIDADWPDPPVSTPPHPDYPAAHSTVTRSMAQALYDQFGDFPFTDHTWDAAGLPPRSYTSWVGLAEETSISRLYGGIHSRPALNAGLQQGEQIGKAVSAIIDGTSS